MDTVESAARQAMQLHAAGRSTVVVLSAPPGSGTTWALRRFQAEVDVSLPVVTWSPWGASRSVAAAWERSEGGLLLIDDAADVSADDAAAIQRIVEWAAQQAGVPQIVVIGGADLTVATSSFVRTLAGLAMTDRVHDVRLRLLDSDELFDLVHSVVGERPSPDLVRRVMQMSEGRSGLATRICRMAQRSGQLLHSGDGLDFVGTTGTLEVALDSTIELAGTSTSSGQTPILDLAHLEPVARLSVELIATAPRRGPFALLQAVIGENLLEDPGFVTLTERRLLDEDGRSYWWVDEGWRSRVLAELTVSQRQQRHAQLADRIGTTWRVEADVLAASLLWHLDAAVNKVPRRRRAELAVDIAGHFETTLEYTRAAAAWDIAARSGALVEEELFHALARAGDAHFEASASYAAIDRLDRAAQLAGQSTITHERCDTVRLRSLQIRAYTGALPDAPVEVAGTGRSRAWTLALLSDQRFAVADPVGAAEYSAAAVAEAAMLDVPEIAARAHFARGLERLLTLRLDDAAAEFARAGDLGDRSTEALVRWMAQARMAMVDWVQGGVGTALSRSVRTSTNDRQRRWWGEGAFSHAVLAAAAWTAGDVAAAELAAQRSALYQRRSGYALSPAIAFPVQLCLAGGRGDEAEVDAVLRLWREIERVPRLVVSLADAMVGRHAAVIVAGRNGASGGLFGSVGLVVQAQLADWLGRPDLALATIDGLRALAERGIVYLPGWPDSIGRSLALALRCAGETAESDALLLRARDQALVENAALTALLCDFDIARFTGDDEAALPALARVTRRFETWGLAGWAARSQREVDRRAGGSGGHEALMWRTIVYTDLVGSTPLNARTGDRRFLTLIAEHQGIVDFCAARWRGTRFHSSGDGFGLWFAREDDAIRCAHDIHEELRQANRRHPDAELRVRIGIAGGQPVPFDGDLYGMTIVRAARVCGLAGTTETWIAGEVLARISGGSLDVIPLGDHLLKGFAEPVQLFKVAPTKEA